MIDSTSAIGLAPAPARLTPAPRPIFTPMRSSADASRLAANSGGVRWKALPFSRASPRLKESALSGPTHVETP